MSARLAQAFAERKAKQQSALVAYVMGGDPSPTESVDFALACLEGGADVLELGMPFSDPIADGPVIQLAAERSLKAGTTLSGVLELAAQVRARSPKPICLMGYLNPVLAMGEATFFERCAKAGVDGVIIPDLPPEEATSFRAHAAKAKVATVFLLAPTSTPERVKAVQAAASGFVYYVTVTGVTGARRELPSDVSERLAQVRAGSPVPVVAGFGIATPDQAKALQGLADGVVVGSAIVSTLAAPGAHAERVAKVKALVASLREGLGG